MSSRALSEIFRLEGTRGYLQPGDVVAAVRSWKDYVHRPERLLWHDYEWGDVHWYCCGSPLEARALLDTVMQAISPRSARELRTIVSRFDAVWNRPSPPYEATDDEEPLADRMTVAPSARSCAGTHAPGTVPRPSSR